MKVFWQPIQFYGDTLYQCFIETNVGTATATSRSKPRALAFALEELAKQKHEEADAERAEQTARERRDALEAADRADRAYTREEA